MLCRALGLPNHLHMSSQNNTAPTDMLISSLRLESLYLLSNACVADPRLQSSNCC